MTLDTLTGQRVALVGFGVENRALGQLLRAHDMPFAVCDARPADSGLKSGWPSVVAWHTGPSYLDELTSYDVLVRTPGISPLHPRLQQAAARGAHITTQMQLFFANCPCPVIGVTGTKGKGTTTMLLAALLKAGQSRRIHVGGNMGQPPIALLDSIHSADLALLEMSSFQLQDLPYSPQTALVLSVTQDHLDYHANIEEYVAAKRNIVAHQHPQDLLISNADCPTAQTFKDYSPAQHWSFSTKSAVEAGAWSADQRIWVRLPDALPIEVCDRARLSLPGTHNLENACAAVAAAAAFGVKPASIAETLSDFRGLPHRLQHVGQQAEIDYYNDSLATTPDAAIAAVRALEQPIILIAGGASKKADFAHLAQVITRTSVHGVLLLGEEGPRIGEALTASNYAGRRHLCASMEEAVAKAVEWARAGDAILLSPACASFGMFSDYKERGECFKRACGLAQS